MAFTNNLPKISAEEGNKILKEYFSKLKSAEEERKKKEREANLKSADAYLSKNADLDGVYVTKSGLQYRVFTNSDGPKPTAHSRVRCHYEGRLCNGQIFDSSYQRGNPAEFSLDQVIPGWAEGLQLMGEGAVYEFTIPPQLGYGEIGVPGHIPGNSVLIFKVELLKVL